MITDINNYAEEIFKSDLLAVKVSFEIWSNIVDKCSIGHIPDMNAPLFFWGKRIYVHDEDKPVYKCGSCGALKEKYRCDYCGEL